MEHYNKTANQTAGKWKKVAHSFNFEIMHMISDKIAQHGDQLALHNTFVAKRSQNGFILKKDLCE